MRHRIERIVRKPHIVHPIDHGMIAKKFRDLPRIFHVPFHAKGKRLNSLQEQKAVKRRQRGAGISLADGAASRDKRRVAEMVDIDHAVIGDLRHG